jgi:hypothetical protein
MMMCMMVWRQVKAWWMYCWSAMVVDDGCAGVVNGLLVLWSEVWAGFSQVLISRRARSKQSGAAKSKGKDIHANAICRVVVIR